MDRPKKIYKKKAAEHHQQCAGTGGGPPKRSRLSSTEEAIYELVKMKESVEGVSGSMAFGKRLLKEDKENVMPEQDNEFEWEVSLPELSPSPVPTSSTKNKIGKVKNAADLIEDELTVQRAMVQTVTKIPEGMKRVYRSLEKLSDLKKQELEETKRHNREMERLRKEEVECKLRKTQQLIEIEQMKCDLFIKKNQI